MIKGTFPCSVAISARAPEVLKEVGYLPEDRGLYRKMKVIDTIVFFAELKGVPPTEARRRGGEWLEKMSLREWRDAKVETLSKGMQQKVQFITTVVHEPPFLILDEPFSGLDPVNQELLQDTVREAKRSGRTVLFSTHMMEQAERLCDEVCIIAGGRKVLDGSTREIRRREAGKRYEIELEAPSEARWIFAIPYLMRGAGGGEFHIAVVDGSSAGIGARVARSLAQRPASGREVTFRTELVAAPFGTVRDSLVQRVRAEAIDGFLDQSGLHHDGRGGVPRERCHPSRHDSAAAGLRLANPAGRASR